MTTSRPDDDMAANPVPDPLPPAISRPREHIQACSRTASSRQAAMDAQHSPGRGH